jgi:hypothetical protein
MHLRLPDCRAADLQQKYDEAQAQLTEMGVEKDAALAGQAAAQTSLAESTVGEVLGQQIRTRQTRSHKKSDIRVGFGMKEEELMPTSGQHGC